MNNTQDNAYRKVEGMLYSYPKTKARIENIKLEIEELNDVVGIKGAGDGVKGSTPTYLVTSSVENEVLSREENVPIKIQTLEREQRGCDRFIRKIDNAINTLDDDERRIVELRYFKRLKIDDIASYVDVGTDTVVRKRRKAIIGLMDILN